MHEGQPTQLDFALQTLPDYFGHGIVVPPTGVRDVCWRRGDAFALADQVCLRCLIFICLPMSV